MNHVSPRRRQPLHTWMIIATLPLALSSAACGDDDQSSGSAKTPTLFFSDGVAISSEPTPTFTGVTDPGAAVALFANDDCSDAPAAEVVADADGAFSATLSVTPNGVTRVTANARSGAGTPSACSPPLDYTHDDIAPGAPALDSSSPDSPSNVNTIAIKGAAESQSDVLFFEGGCDSEVIHTAPAEELSGGVGVVISVPDDTTVSLRAVAVDRAGNRSACSTPFIFVEDSTPPAVPDVTGLTTYGPSPETQSGILGSAEEGADVLVFGGAGCDGEPLARENAAGLNGGSPLNFPLQALDAVTRVYVQAEDAAGNRSECGDTGYSYIHDSSSPPPPIVECDPGGYSLMVNVSGVGPVMGSVLLYAAKDCEGEVAATAVVDASGEYSVDVEIPALNTEVFFSGIATSVGGLSSACSTAATYVHDNAPPQPPTLTFEDESPSATILDPVIRGTGEPNALAELFADGGCAGAAVQNTVVNGGGNFAFAAAATPNAHSFMSARLTDQAGNVSDCSSGLTWTHDDTPPSLQVSDLVPTTYDSADLAYTSLTDNLTVLADMVVEVCVGAGPADCSPFVAMATVGPGAPGVLEIPALLAPDTRQYVWARPVDEAGNVGTTVGPLNARTPGTAGTLSLALGGSHGCVATDDGAVQCFGQDNSGQLGTLGNPTDQLTPTTPVAELSDAVEVATGQAHSCARTSNGDVYCWGDNTFGQIGGTLGNGSDAPQKVALGQQAQALALGSDHSCALTAGGDVICWGRGDLGQLGAASASTANPVSVGASAGVRAIAAGGSHNCAITAVGQVWCWGDDALGQLGNGPGGATGPVQVALPKPAIDLAVGVGHTCAALSDGKVRCWGSNTSQQLGAGLAATSLDAPVVVQSLSNVVAVVAGAAHTCARQASGDTYCWGDNGHGQVGDGTTVERPLRTLLTDAPSFVALAAGGDATCGITAAGQAHCWGDNAVGGLGLGATTDYLTPAPLDISAVTRVRGVVAGDSISGAIWSNGQLVLWGDGGDAKKGNAASSDPDASPTVANVSSDGLQQVGFGQKHGCALDGAGVVSCWGYDDKGQVSASANVALMPPTAVAGLPPAKALAVGRNHACVAAANGQVVCWGDNAAGQLGASALTPVAGVNDAIAVAAGDLFSCALRGDGTAVCWGTSTMGQLGFASSDGLVHNASTVPSVLLGSSITAGRAHVCVRQTTGEAVCWGDNTKGQLGDGTLAGIKPAKGVQGASDLVGIQAGAEHTCGLGSNGQLWCWGAGEVGQLGQGGSGNNFGTPQPAATDGVTAVATGWNHTCTSGLNGVQCVGANFLKQLGSDDVIALAVDFVDVPAAP